MSTNDAAKLRPSATSTSDRSLVQSLQRAFTLIDHLIDSERPLSALELSRESGVERTTVHRILRTLETEQLVVASNGKYGIGPRALLYGNAYLDRLAIRRASLPFEIEILTTVIGSQPWAVHIYVPIAAEITLVSQLYGSNAHLGNLDILGSRFPIDESAAGRCILAHLPDSAVVDLLGGRRARSIRPRLEKVLRDGVDHETKIGMTALAAPIVDGSGEAVGGISLSGIGVEEHTAPDSAIAMTLRRAAVGIGRSI